MSVLSAGDKWYLILWALSHVLHCPSWAAALPIAMLILKLVAYLHSLPLPVKKELQGYEAVYDVLKLLLGLLHGRLFPESAAAAQQAQMHLSVTGRPSQGGKAAC